MSLKNLRSGKIGPPPSKWDTEYVNRIRREIESHNGLIPNAPGQPMFLTFTDGINFTYGITGSAFDQGIVSGDNGSLLTVAYDTNYPFNHGIDKRPLVSPDSSISINVTDKVGLTDGQIQLQVSAYSVLSALSVDSIASDDYLPFEDVSGSDINKVTITDFFDQSWTSGALHYQEVQNAGSGLTKRRAINLLSPLEAADNGGTGLTELRLNASAADKYLYSTAADTWTEGSITTTGRSLVASASASAARDTLGASSGVWPATVGGTGLSSYTTGDLLYASTTTALSKLAASTSGYVLTANGAGVAPSWQALPASYSDEQAQDAVFNAVTATTPLTKNYDDASNAFTLGLAGLSTLGTALYYHRTNAGATAWEYRSPAQVLSDIAGVGGSGTSGKLPKWTGTTTLGDSLFTEGTNEISCSKALGVQGATPSAATWSTAGYTQGLVMPKDAAITFKRGSETNSFAISCPSGLNRVNFLASTSDGASSPASTVAYWEGGLWTTGGWGKFLGLPDSGLIRWDSSPTYWGLSASTSALYFLTSTAADASAAVTARGNWTTTGLMVGGGLTAAARALEVRSTSAQIRASYDPTYYWELGCASDGAKKWATNSSSVGSTELEATRTITGAVTDGYAAGLLLDPGYSGAYTVTRHNYLDCQDVSLAASAVLTDACLVRFDAAAGTHKATVGATTKTTPGGVDAWIKININGTLYYVPAYTSTTA